MRNYHHFDFHAFDELVRARDAAVKYAAELKLLNLSFYAPQMYYYPSSGTFTTMFGEVRGRWPVEMYDKKQPVEPHNPLLPGQVVTRGGTVMKMTQYPLQRASRTTSKQWPKEGTQVTPKQSKTQKMRTWGRSLGLSFGKSVMEYFKSSSQEKGDVAERT